MRFACHSADSVKAKAFRHIRFVRRLRKGRMACCGNRCFTILRKRRANMYKQRQITFHFSSQCSLPAVRRVSISRQNQTQQQTENKTWITWNTPNIPIYTNSVHFHRSKIHSFVRLNFRFLFFIFCFSLVLSVSNFLISFGSWKKERIPQTCSRTGNWSNCRE